METTIHGDTGTIIPFSLDLGTPSTFPLAFPSLNRSNTMEPQFSGPNSAPFQSVNLKLASLAILQSITFKKQPKSDAPPPPRGTQLKEFRVFGGPTPDSMVLLLHSTLRAAGDTSSNASNAEDAAVGETFELTQRLHNGLVVPVQYLKIAPSAPFHQHHHQLQLAGDTNTDRTNEALRQWSLHKECESVRLMLKHLRQRGCKQLFDMLVTSTSTSTSGSGVLLEHPSLTLLHTALVERGDFTECESIIKRANAHGHFDSHVSVLKYTPTWTRIMAESESNECTMSVDTTTSSSTPSPPVAPAPGPRGGHQMIIDCDDSGGTSTSTIYLYGGWDGRRDLGDMWAFDTSAMRWSCISANTAAEGGPGPRSCHKMCLDSTHRRIYTLGRYVDPDSRGGAHSLKSDLYYYDIRTDTWHRVSHDTKAEGGPELIYDHQMSFDQHTGLMYVFGGRTITTAGPPPPMSDSNYSGFYCYNPAANSWRQISTRVKGRIGHTMLIDHVSRSLYLFAGQRHKDYISDFVRYDLDLGTWREISKDTSLQHGPGAGFTQRATLDVTKGEVYVLSGLTKGGGGSGGTASSVVRNSFWVYSAARNAWSRVYHNDNTDPAYWTPEMMRREPCPRFAHQLVLDTNTKVHYLFGGNPGDSAPADQRLDDFWALHLSRPTSDDIERRCLFLIRKQRFLELCMKGEKSEALSYLQSQVRQTVNANCEEEEKEFRSLAACIFSGGRGSISTAGGGCASPVIGGLLGGPQKQRAEQKQQTTCMIGQPEDQQVEDLATRDVFRLRTKLFEDLIFYFPEDMKQPTANLVDMA